MAKDHIKLLVRELTTVGIKPEVSKTGGGHTTIEWDVEGKSHKILTSSTPSDFRATLNARARVRKMLRDAGVYDRPPQSLFEKAISAPLQLAEPLLDRVAQLEADFGALLDLVIEARMKGGNGTESFAAGWNAHAEATQKALTKLAVPNDESRKRGKYKKGGWILFHLDYHWMTTAEIKARCKERKASQVYTALWSAKQKGLIENNQGRWRKVIHEPATRPSHGAGHG